MSSRGNSATRFVALTAVMLATLVGVVLLANELRQIVVRQDATAAQLAQLNDVRHTVSRLNAVIQNELARSMLGDAATVTKIQNVVVTHTAHVDQKLAQMAVYAPDAALGLKRDVTDLVSVAVQAVEAFKRGDDGTGETRHADLRRLVDRLGTQIQDVSGALTTQSAESAAELRTVWNGILALLGGGVLLGAGICAWEVRERREDAPATDAGFAEPVLRSVTSDMAHPLSDSQVRQFAMALSGYLRERDRRRVADRTKAVAETRLGALMEAGRIGAFRIADSSVEDANSAFAMMLGFPDVNSLLDAYGPSGGSPFADPEEGRRLLDRVAEKAAVHGEQVRFLREDGTRVTALVSGYSVANGGSRRCELLAIDVTDTVEQETKLKTALEEARYADRAKSEFLANISHELRTPLNAIIGFSEVLMDRGLRPRNPDTVDEYLGDIRDSGLHLLSLVSDLLDVSRIEAGRTDLREEELNVADLADSAIRMVRRQATEGGIRVGFSGNRADCLLRADRRAVKQILVNLLSNAVKFTPSGGSVTVSCDGAANGALDVLVTDSGVGIAEENIPVVLERFGQVNGVPRINGEGTGLGLPLAQALVRLHGGELSIRSTPNVGTTVRVTFPAERRVRQTALGMV